MRIKNLFILLIFFIVGCSQAQEKNFGHIVKIGDKSPHFKVKLIDGTSFSNKNLARKVTMLQFTASWCGVCRKEMPILKEKHFISLQKKEQALLVT